MPMNEPDSINFSLKKAKDVDFLKILRFLSFIAAKYLPYFISFRRQLYEGLLRTCTYIETSFA